MQLATTVVGAAAGAAASSGKRDVHVPVRYLCEANMKVGK